MNRLAAQAALAGVEESAGDCLPHHDIEVGVVEDDERVRATEFQEALLDRPPCTAAT